MALWTLSIWLPAVSQPGPRSRRGHEDRVRAVDLSPDLGLGIGS